MGNGIFAYLIGIGTFLFGLYVLVFFVPLGLWIKALISGLEITLLELIDMKIRRVPPSPIVQSMILAAKEGIDIQMEALEAHCMAGGDVEHVVQGMIVSRNNNVHLSFKEACEKDLARKNLSKDKSHDQVTLA
jgi:uncharacterized protein YqfA (UPF0365 family)